MKYLYFLTELMKNFLLVDMNEEILIKQLIYKNGGRSFTVQGPMSQIREGRFR
jgi:hypothetical protein